jgi:hypothetical protein
MREYMRRRRRERSLKWGYREASEAELRRRFGIDFEDWARLYEAQCARCAICRLSIRPEGRGTHLDHCHTSGQARGLLCSGCNVGLGNYKESPETLEAAARYLRRFNS